jgi:hypothetical protein
MQGDRDEGNAEDKDERSHDADDDGGAAQLGVLGRRGGVGGIGRRADEIVGRAKRKIEILVSIMYCTALFLTEKKSHLV